MPFLRINGWTVPVAIAKASRKVTAPGRRGRSYRGQMRDTRRFSRLAWDVECAFSTAEDAHALQQLVLGHGHVFDLRDGLQAGTSLLPDAYDASLILDQFENDSRDQPGRATFGASATGAVFVVDAQLGDDWTVHARVRDSSEGEWIARAWRSDGAAFVAGERDDGAARPVALGGYLLRAEVTGGIVLLVKDGGATSVAVDDLLVLPFRASDSMLAAISAPVDEVPLFGDLPQLAVDGSIFDEAGGACTVQGELGDSDIVEGGDARTDQGWIPNARVVRFTLTQVLPQFVR